MILNATIGSTTYTLGVLRDSYSFSKRCGEAGKHSISSVRCAVRPVDLSGKNFGAAVFQADGLVPATLLNGNTTVFTGYIRPYTSTSARNSHADNVEIELMDPTESMHEYVWPVGEEGGAIKATVYQGKTLKENITTLFGLVGKTCDTSGLGNFTMPWFRLSEGEYVDEVIAQVLFEFGYDYQWTANGVATFFSTFKPSSVTRKISDIRNTLSTSRSDDTSEGLKITYSIYRESPNVKIYNNSNKYSFEWWNIFSDGTIAQQLEGKYWKGAMHDSRFNQFGNKDEPIPSGMFSSWMFEETGLKNADGKDISESDVYYIAIDPSSQVNVWLEDEDGITLTTHFDGYDATGFRLWVDYSGWFQGKWTWRIEIYGKIGYRVDSEVSFNKVGPNPETLNLRYRLMLDGTVDQTVQQFASQYAARKKASAVTYGFDSLTEYEVGGFYILENTVGGSSQVVRIISMTKDADGIYSYKCEGASTVNEIAITTSYDGGNAPLKMTAYEQALANGFVGTEEDYIRANAEAKVLSLELSSQTFARDFRKTGATTIKLQVLSSGYTGTATLTVVDSMGHDITVTGGEFSIPFSNNLDYVDVTATIGDKTVTKRVSVIDNTQYFKNWGYQGSAPTSGTFITGDYYYNTTTKCRYVYSGSAWVYDNSQEKYIRISSVNPSTLPRNDRDNASTTSVHYEADWTGYESIDLKWYLGTVADGNLIGSGASVSKAYSVKNLSAPTVLLCNGSETAVTFTHSIIDMTDKNMYLGAASGSGALTATPIDGDFYYDSSLHKPMFRKNGQWVVGTKENVGDNNLFERMLSFAQRDILADHVISGTEVSGEYGYFYNLITELLVVNAIVSNDYKEGESGFRLDGNTGTMEAVDALLSGSISVDHAFVSKGVFRIDRFYPEWF